MDTYVLDASFVLSSVLSENPFAERLFKEIFASQDRGTCKIVSLPLLDLEVANGLRFSVGEIAKSRLLYDRYSKLSIDIFDLKSHHIKEIMSISYKINGTVYDCAYHFLAILLKGTFLTCDKKYFKSAKALGFIRLAE